MKKLTVIITTLLLGLTVAAQQTNGLKGPVRSVHHVKIDSSTCQWEGCYLKPPTFEESRFLVFAKDGLLEEKSSNSRYGGFQTLIYNYNKKRQLVQVLGKTPNSNYREEYRYKGKKLMSYKQIYVSDHMLDTFSYRCEYDSKGRLLHITNEEEYTCPEIKTYDSNGFLITEDFDSHIHIVYLRNNKGLLQKMLEYHITSYLDENDEWHCRTQDTAYCVTEYLYTDKGEIAEERVTEYGKYSVTTFRYLEHDEYGNWTRRKIAVPTVSGDSVVYDEIRMFTYYPDKSKKKR
ncbi:MAG: hypothetical protein IKX51_03940, partial [Bacteroidales bacterium]|nr:hypothetical protein [Bacteroidales bacterium]